MTASSPQLLLGRLIGELTDAVVEVVLRAGPRQNSIEVELALGKKVEAHVRQEIPSRRWVGAQPLSQDQFLGRLADAVYRVALETDVRLSFLDLELGIWNVLRRIVEGPTFRTFMDQFFKPRNAALGILIRTCRMGRDSRFVRKLAAAT